MPFSSKAQQRFMFAKHPEIAKEFADATPDISKLPEHVKKMDEGGIAEPDDKKFATEIGTGITGGINHDSDAVKSYLASKFHQVMGVPTEDNVNTSSTTSKGMTEGGYAEGGYAEGGYPHVTFLENESPAQVKKDTHMEGHEAGPMDTTETGEKTNPSHMASGGDVSSKGNPEHEKKLSAIYKAMGIKKYADGGVIQNGQQVNDANPTPNPSDPSYWTQIKNALSQVGGAVGNTLQNTLPTMPGVAKEAANMAATPGAAEAINAGLGTSLEGAPAMPPTPTSPPAIAPSVPQMPVSRPTSTSIGGGNQAPSASELQNLFNQDTSKLTEGSNAEDRNALVNKLGAQQHSLGAIVAQAVAGLGDAMAAKGGKEQHALGNIFNMQKQQRDEALANFDKARQDRIQKLALQTQMGTNSIQKLAAQDAYGTDEHLNRMLGAPAGTAHKDLPLYFQMKSAQVAQQEKDADLYMKAHAQAAAEVDNAVKNASFWGTKPNADQIQAKGSQLATKYIAQAKGLYQKATHPQTGHQIETYDGGQSWKDVGAK